MLSPFLFIGVTMGAKNNRNKVPLKIAFVDDLALITYSEQAVLEIFVSCLERYRPGCLRQGNASAGLHARLGLTT